MTHGDPGLRDAGVGSAAPMPFERHLRPVFGSTPSTGLAAPLPLSGLAKVVGASGCALFIHSCLTVEAEILAVKGDAITTRLQPEHWLSLIHVYAGSIVLSQNGLSVTAGSGGWLVVPGVSTLWQSSPFSAVCLMVSRSEISRQCERMTVGPGHCPMHEWLLTGLPSASLDADPGEVLMLRALERTIQTISEFMDGHLHLLLQLKQEEQLSRLAALLLTPESRAALPGDGPGSDDEQTLLSRFDDLLIYIDDNLDQPLNLTLLQSHIHYSRRAVQYAFQKRLGCTATQWIRARRLDRARELLLQASTEDSVARIAQSCGYRSMSLFSIDFQQRFHIKPSILLRRGRNDQPCEAPADPDQGGERRC